MAIRNLGIIFALMSFLCTLYLVATEYVLSQQSKGEVLLFRRRHVPASQSAGDEEASNLYNRPLAHVAHDKDSQASRDLPVHVETYGASLAWDRLSYNVKNKNGSRNILDNIEGWVKPRTLTALMVRL